MDKQTLNALIDEYIRENYIPDKADEYIRENYIPDKADEYIRENYIPDNADYLQKSGGGIRSWFNSILSDATGSITGTAIHSMKPIERSHRRKKPSVIPDFSYLGNRKLNFAINKKLEDKGETFSEMLSRFIKESGKKNSEVYKLANVKRQFFSKIVSNADYQPSKQVVLAFALALKLEFEKTRELLASAGYILSRAKKFDLIISACLENKFYDVDRINEILDERKLPLLGSRPEKENNNDDEN